MTDQLTLWGEGWKRPPLDRELTYLEEDHEAHMIQASDFYNWAITMRLAAMTHAHRRNPCACLWATIGQRCKNSRIISHAVAVGSPQNEH